MEQILKLLITVISAAAQILAIFIIGLGMIKATISYFRESLIHRDSKKAIVLGRLELGLSFSLGLGFLIGSSILKSTIAPTWDDIGKLFSIILIRTFMNYFLQIDISKANKELEPDQLPEKSRIEKFFNRLTGKKKEGEKKDTNRKDKDKEKEKEPSLKDNFRETIKKEINSRNGDNKNNSEIRD